MDWLQISLLLSFLGLLKEIRPSEPFISDYMKEPYREVTKDELNRYIYPIATYAMGILSIVVLLITDWLRYKPMILFMGFAGMVTWSLLLWTKSYFGAQLIEVSYAAYSASEVAYYAYIYAKVSKEHYSAVTSHTRAGLMIGRIASGVISQVLMHFNIMGIHELNYITLSAQIIATMFAAFLPKVSQSIYFYRTDVTVTSSSNIGNGLAYTGVNCEFAINSPDTTNQRICRAFQLMKAQIKCAYSSRKVLLWSMWYSLGMCGYLQIVAYVQLLWIHIDDRPEVMWNGAIEAVTTLLCAIIALLASRLHSSVINSKLKVLSVLFVLSIFASGAIFIAANTSDRFISYAGYMMFYMLYTFTITISSAEIAKELPEDSYGLIFGINTFVAYCAQTLLTLAVVADSFSLNLSIVNQFNVYGSYFIVLSLIYLLFIADQAIKWFFEEKPKQNLTGVYTNS